MNHEESLKRNQIERIIIALEVIKSGNGVIIKISKIEEMKEIWFSPSLFNRRTN